jgi:hypothetical protein
MESLHILFQIIIPLGIVNVWLLRPAKATPYRGGTATSLKGEFAAYGLPEAVFYVVGFLKLSAAALLLGGIWIPALKMPGAALMAAMMLGAVAMHAKVKDPAIRYLPASLMLIMSLVLLA